MEVKCFVTDDMIPKTSLISMPPAGKNGHFHCLFSHGSDVEASYCPPGVIMYAIATI